MCLALLIYRVAPPVCNHKRTAGKLAHPELIRVKSTRPDIYNNLYIRIGRARGRGPRRYTYARTRDLPRVPSFLSGGAELEEVLGELGFEGILKFLLCILLL